MTWAGVRIYSDPHTGPYKIHPLFSNKKASKTEVFKAFWSCYPDLNRRPHPYQAALELFSNYFSYFIAIYTPICLLSATF